MSRFQASMLLVLLLTLSVETSRLEGCHLQTIGGGCPDKNACLETCRPCYRGIGTISTSCFGPGGGIPYWICNCEFKNGAPCPPVGPPTCPKPPAIAYLNRPYNATRVNNNLVIGEVN